jgi:hypothetical protein
MVYYAAQATVPQQDLLSGTLTMTAAISQKIPQVVLKWDIIGSEMLILSKRLTELKPLKIVNNCATKRTDVIGLPGEITLTQPVVG